MLQALELGEQVSRPGARLGSTLAAFGAGVVDHVADPEEIHAAAGSVVPEQAEDLCPVAAGRPAGVDDLERELRQECTSAVRPEWQRSDDEGLARRRRGRRWAGGGSRKKLRSRDHRNG